MRNFEKKTSWKNIIESKPILIFLGVLILIFAWSVFRFLIKMEETGKNKEIVEEKVIAMREKKDNLVNDIESLNTDEGKEKFFRENYGLAKEGEQVIVVVEEKKPISSENTGFSSKLFLFFRNLFQ